MVFERLNYTFSRIDSVVMGLNKLVRAIFLHKEFLDDLTCLIVQHIEGWFIPLALEVLEGLFECCTDGAALKNFHWLHQYCISGVVICH